MCKRLKPLLKHKYTPEVINSCRVCKIYFHLWVYFTFLLAFKMILIYKYYNQHHFVNLRQMLFELYIADNTEETVTRYFGLSILQFFCCSYQKITLGINFCFTYSKTRVIIIVN